LPWLPRQASSPQPAHPGFVKKCEADAKKNVTAACDTQAADKKLAGAAKTSFVKKCVADASAK